MKVVMKSLKELSTMTILSYTVDQEHELHERMRIFLRWPPFDRQVRLRCACELWWDKYFTRHSTNQFISLLPLPENIKAFVQGVSMKICEDGNHEAARKEISVKEVKPLQELSAKAILDSSIHPFHKMVEGGEWVTRCACDQNCWAYTNVYTTEEFIYLLPLPQILKDVVSDLSKKICADEDHSSTESDYSEDDSSDSDHSQNQCILQ